MLELTRPEWSQSLDQKESTISRELRPAQDSRERKLGESQPLRQGGGQAEVWSDPFLEAPSTAPRGCVSVPRLLLTCLFCFLQSPLSAQLTGKVCDQQHGGSAPPLLSPEASFTPSLCIISGKLSLPFLRSGTVWGHHNKPQTQRFCTPRS